MEEPFVTEGIGNDLKNIFAGAKKYFQFYNTNRRVIHKGMF